MEKNREERTEVIPHYIPPITKIYSTFAEAKKFFGGDGGFSWYDNEESTDLATLVQGKRNPQTTRRESRHNSVSCGLGRLRRDAAVLAQVRARN
jgi:hypothetical protein